MPDLASQPIDREGDAAALRALAGWMGRYSPLVAIEGADGLLLETTGCDHLFGGETALLDDIQARLTAAGITVRLGLAGTRRAALALAHGAPGPGPHRLAGGEERDGLAPLPVAALGLSPDTLRLLRRFGLTRIGELCGLDRKALARRFQSRDAADDVVLRLDQALGLRRDPIAALRAPPRHARRLACPEPLLQGEGVRAGLCGLLDRLCEDLAGEGCGAQSFRLIAFRADGTHQALEIATARPSRDPAHLMRLFNERLAGLDPGHGIDLLLLEAHRTAPLEAAGRPLSAGLAAHAIDETALSALADRIAARLGAGSVRVNWPVASHWPDRAGESVPYGGRLPPPRPADASAGPRPLRLLARPEPLDVLAEVPDGPPLRFVWRRIARRVIRADGPERIAPEWWRLQARGGRARDYYRVEDAAGGRYWVFREGLYGDGRGGAPLWYLQGLFP